MITRDSSPDFPVDECPTVPTHTPSGRPVKEFVQKSLRDVNAATEEASDALRELRSAIRRESGPTNVLFVDDDRANLAVYQALCGQTFHVLLASGGAEALDLLRKSDVGVVVADQRMPVMSGVDLLSRVRRDYPNAVRILVTAYADFQAAVDAVNRAHVWKFLRKPWSNDELVATLHEALRLHAERRTQAAE